MWWVPVLVFVACFVGGIAAAARWLPELGRGPIGGLAFFVVCGLVGAGVGLLGLHVYLTIRQVEVAGELLPRGGGFFGSKGATLAEGLVTILYECGVVFGVAAIVFLLAPREVSTEPRTRP